MLSYLDSSRNQVRIILKETQLQQMIEQANQLEQFEGYVIFVLINKGTKSERYAPLLLPPGGSTVLLQFEDDFTLQSKKLLPYHKCWCRLDGFFLKDNKTFTVQTIHKSSDPVEPLLSALHEGGLKSDQQTPDGHE
jgi:hypothetical protein